MAETEELLFPYMAEHTFSVVYIGDSQMIILFIAVSASDLKVGRFAFLKFYSLHSSDCPFSWLKIMERRDNQWPLPGSFNAVYWE